MKPDEIATNSSIQRLLDKIGGVEDAIKALSNKLAADQYLTVQEYAKKYKISPRTVQRHIKNGRLKSEKIGRTVRILHKS